MTVGVLTCTPDTALPELARQMIDRGCESVVVMADGHALGVVSEDELVAAFSRATFDHPDHDRTENFRPGTFGLTVEDVMREGVPQVPPDIPLTAAAQVMRDLGVRTLFLMHHAGGVEYPAAQISYRHLLRYLASEDADDLRDLGIYAERQSPLETFILRRDEARKKAGGKPA